MYAEPGRSLGKYRLIAEIARGGMGIVYLAMVQGPGGFNKLVVVKELKPDLVEEPAFLRMFLDEAKLAARLNHPNIVQTNEVGSEGQRYFMAMDYLDGRGLDRIRRRARTAGWGLSVPMNVRVACDMLAGLDYAHKLADFDGTALDIVHRDVSPQNIFITFDGQVKLLDFGIAKTAESHDETKAGMLKGKVSYMAPEQARGAKVDARADVYAAGVILWEALTGKKLRQGNEAEIMAALVAGEAPRIASIKPSIAAELDEICARSLAIDPVERYQSAADFGAALEHYLTSSNTNISTREVGASVSELFREDRSQINARIEAHIARARNENPRDDLPIIEMSYEPHAAHTPVPGQRESSVSTPSHLSSIGQGSSDPGAGGAAPSAHQAHPPVPARRKGVLVGVAIGALAAGGIIVYAVTRPPAAIPQPPAIAAAPAASPPAIVPPAATTMSPAPEPTAHSIEVSIKVSPANAAVTVDGVNLPTNPFHGKYLADTNAHEVRASAPGFLPKTSPVTFDGNVTLDVSLERAPVVARTPPPVRTPVAVHTITPPPPVTPPPPPVVTKGSNEIDPNGGIKPRRPIESSNPYGAK